MTSPRKTKKAAAQPATVREAPRDELAETLVAAELVPNTYILDLNGSLTVPHTMELPAPWNLPSRLFRFPVVVTRRSEDGTRRIMLRHPQLAAHPFVQQVYRGGSRLRPHLRGPARREEGQARDNHGRRARDHAADRQRRTFRTCRNPSQQLHEAIALQTG